MGGTAVLISSHDLTLLNRFQLTRFALALEKNSNADGKLLSKLKPLEQV